MPVGRSRLIAVVRRVAITRGALPARRRLASSAYVVQGFDGPVPAQPVGQVGRAGLGCAQVGDRVDGDGGPAAGGQVQASAADP